MVFLPAGTGTGDIPPPRKFPLLPPPISPSILKSKDNTDNKPGTYAPDRTLPRDPKTGKAIPDEEAKGTEHTQLGSKKSRSTGETYSQRRTFDKDGNPTKDVDFTDHGRPQQHTNPHQHKHTPNPSGSPQRGSAEPLD